MTKLYNLLNNKIPESSGAIIEPIEAEITVIESCFDGDAETDWMRVTSPALLYRDVVIEWACNHSGLDGWHIVPGYPYLNKYRMYEWKLKRKGI